jgi:hypothetical protein
MKKKSRECFCALCRSPRKLRYPRHLSLLNYSQIIFLSAVFSAGLWNWLGEKSLVVLPIVWAIFESVHKSLYRKDLKCPHCGFDPKWYKKDVKLARQKVEEFLKQNPDAPIHRRRNNGENPFANLSSVISSQHRS